jgi:hypothetical protein
MKKLAIFAAGILALVLFAVPASAGNTDTAALSITVNDTYYVSAPAAADWTYTLVDTDFNNGYASTTCTDGLDVAANAQYEVTAQMSAATWDAAITLSINVESAGATNLNDTSATVITGLDNEAAGSQSNLDFVWKLDGITWDNTAGTDDWTNTVTFTCQANT